MAKDGRWTRSAWLSKVGQPIDDNSKKRGDQHCVATEREEG